MINNSIFLIFFLHVNAMALRINNNLDMDVIISSDIQRIMDSFMLKYSRPITILYISDNPVIIKSRDMDVVVIISKNENFFDRVRREGLNNYIILSCGFDSDTLGKLSKCEHFDISVIDTECVKLCSPIYFLSDISILKKKDILTIVKKKKTILHNNWFNSASNHKNYIIISNLFEKFMIKPKEYTSSGIYKKYDWHPGINLYTYACLNGVYPSKKYLREKIIEIFNPVYHKDFGLANLIIQGRSIRAIDYDDTVYSENSYLRLEKALVKQLGVGFK